MLNITTITVPYLLDFVLYCIYDRERDLLGCCRPNLS